MVGATNIVTRNDSNESSSAIRTGRLEATQRVRLDGSVRAIAIASCLHASVDTSGITAPHFDICICDGLAGRRIDNVNVKVSDGTLFTSQEVLSDKLTNDP